MYERKITTLGAINKKTLREFMGKTGKRITDAELETARVAYNTLVDKIKKEKKIIRNELTNYYVEPQTEELKESRIKEQNKRISSILELPRFIKPDLRELKESRKKYQKEQTDKKNKEKEYYKKNVKIIDVIDYKPSEDETLNRKSIMGYMRNFLKSLIGKSALVIYKIGNKIIQEVLEIIPSTFSSWWRSYSKWWVNSSEDLFEQNNYAGKLYMYPENEKINKDKVFQYFRDGISNCLFTPILEKAKFRFEEAKGESTKKRYSKLIKDCVEFIEKYPNGVPEDSLNTIANDLQIDIKIKFPLANNFIEAKSIKKAVMSFVFTNTRLNHVDINEITYDNNFKFMNQEELDNLILNLNKNGDFYIYELAGSKISTVRTLSGNYKSSSDINDIIHEFENKNNLHDYKIDDIDDYQLSQFVRMGTHYNATVDFVDINNIYSHKTDGVIQSCAYNNNSIQHCDMKKAYANFFTSKFYNGFLGKITDFRACNKIEAVGLYYICNINLVGKLKELNNKLQIYSDGVYPSCELEMLYSYGCSFDIIYGCWGVEPIDFRFDDSMMGSDSNGSKIYAKCVGMWDSHNTEKQFWYKGCEKHFNAIQQYCDNGLLRRYGEDKNAIFIKKEHNHHLGHFTAFITSYQRINTIEQLMSMDLNKVVRVCVDGIYTTEKDFKMYNVFRLKTDYNFNNEAGFSYISKYENEFICGEIRQHYKKELFLGAGGCGKTHNNLVDIGLVKPCYVAPSWKLARNKQTEYKCEVSVWERILSTDPEKINYVKRRFNTLIIDEVSMMTNEQKNRIFDLYKNCKIIFCGDIGHQLAPIGGESMDMNGFDNIYTYSVNRRCKCDKLADILIQLRKFHNMNKNVKFIKDWIKTIMPVYTVDDLQKMYNINDMILVGTHEQKNKYTALFTNKFETEKYRITSCNRIHSNGEIIISNEKPCSSEIQHAFTIHSIQGETALNKLFIDINRLFDNTMLYTAISRASYLNQIYLIV